MAFFGDKLLMFAFILLLLLNLFVSVGAETFKDLLQVCTYMTKTAPTEKVHLIYLGSGLIKSYEVEGGTLTAGGLVVLVIWEQIIQSLFTGVRVLLLLMGERTRTKGGGGV